MPALGSHCVLELYDCPAAVLDDVDAVLAALKTATDDAGATLLQLSHHRFAPQGLTALALLSESHISVHTWPERGYAACDVFTCGRETRPEAACMALVEALQCERYVLRRFPRGQELPQATATPTEDREDPSPSSPRARPA
ncbi:MAG: adenosylmethionine decarboxylase [Myxococcota bacterium]